MRLALYTQISLSLIMIMGAITYTITPEHYVITISNMNIDFLIAIWIMLPLLILFIFTLSYMLIFSIKNFFKQRKWHRDTKILEDSIYWSILHEPKKRRCSVSRLKESVLILSNSSINISNDIEGLSPKLEETVIAIQNIKNGQYINLKEHKISKLLCDKNPILIQNRLNQLKSDKDFIYTIMKSNNKYLKDIRVEALKLFAEKEDFVEASKYIKVFDIKNFLIMLDRVTAENRLSLNIGIIKLFIKHLNLECKDFIKVVSITKQYFSPEENLTLFKNFQKENNKAQNAYLYLLFEYELLDEILSYLEEEGDGDFIKFRAFYLLKREHNYKYNLEDIIEIGTICDEIRL